MAENRIRQGDTITFEGTKYHVMHVCRGEGQARAIQRKAPTGQKWYYRTINGQWCVIRESDYVAPAYVFKQAELSPEAE